MPLMHSESLADHQLHYQSMEDLKSRLEAKGDEAAENVEQGLSFAKKHSDISHDLGDIRIETIVLGGRLGEERKWLDEGGERFGA